ncbi:hypothetical protein KFK09_002079 [Dendrobium nobile]|uniref:EF-hand domain-containing protein n=1 Tax=Dendrobium nobile TaxID=94219 RepID=A0A8T3C994_DENNO|nr:hypothetical protein KFK09_002079 [Dendrobium nobile]
MVATNHPKWFMKLSLHGFRRPKKKELEHPKGSFQEVFSRLDSDGDGRISIEELRSFLGWTGDHVLPDEVATVVSDIDVDDDGFIDYCSFVRLVDGGHRRGEGREGERDYEEDIRRAFEMFKGEEGEGSITPRGLQRVLGRLGDEKSEEDCAAMIRVYDLDGNGVLDYHEFHRMMG